MKAKNSLITKPVLDGLCFMYFLSFKSIQLAKKNKNNPFPYLQAVRGCYVTLSAGYIITPVGGDKLLSL